MSTSHQRPFDQLHGIVDSLREKASIAGKSVDLQPVLAELSQWVAEAEQRRERSASIIASTSDAFVACNEDGSIIEWNDQAEAIFGRSRNRLMNVLSIT